MKDPTLMQAGFMHVLYKKGDSNLGHSHEQNHTHVLLMGSVRMEQEGGDTVDYTAPAIMDVKADVFHKFTALTDDVAYICAFPRPGK